MNPETTSGYWLDRAVADILKHYPKGDIVVSSGISPSASYHIGHFREIMTADALTWGIRQAARKAKHVHVVDNFDPLRKRYPFLPEEYEQYVGQPICLIPDPFEKCRAKHKTYAEHFFQEFEGYIHQMGIVPDEVVRSYEDLYKTGRMAPQIDKALEHIGSVKKIFEEVSGRELPDDWTPVQLMDSDQRFHNADLTKWDRESQTIEDVSYADGRAKLNWRLDWPARWQLLGVEVEPFSAQEHGAAGGSYETGARFSKEVFGYEPPIPGVQYANIHLVGETKKMSSSKGNLVTPAQALEIMPPEVLRYFVVRSKPDRTLYFDSGLELYRLLDEFSLVQAAVLAGQDHDFKEAYAFATAVGAGTQGAQVISSIPFSHLVSVYQAAQGDPNLVFEVLERTGFKDQVASEKAVLTDELPFVKNWLAKYAPEEVKFTVQEKLPKVELSAEQTTFLDTLADALKSHKDLDGQGMHDLIYETFQAQGLKPAQAFQALYRLILNKDSGPKAGWFLASLDHDWLIKRLSRQA